MTNSANIITELDAEFVELYKVLKFEGLAHSGGFAKQIIADGLYVSTVKLKLKSVKK